MAQRMVTAAELQEARARSKELLRDGGFYYVRTLPDGRVIYLAPGSQSLPLTKAMRLGIAVSGDVSSYYAAWDFEPSSANAAWRAAIGWDGEDAPKGWFRHHPGARPPQTVVTPRSAPAPTPQPTATTLDPGALSNAEILMRLVNGAVAGTIQTGAEGILTAAGYGLLPGLTLAEARRIVSRTVDFDYFMGRSIKVNVAERPLMIARYDRDNGAGAAARALGLDAHDVH